TLYTGQPLEVGQAFSTQLVQDSGKHLHSLDSPSKTRSESQHTFCFGMSRDCKSVGRQRCLHLGVVEVDHRAVLFNHVQGGGATTCLFDPWDVIYSELLEGTLKFLVICCGCPVHHLFLSASCTL
ncbi:unnamed protein product, partial [Ixodes pacificus]